LNFAGQHHSFRVECLALGEEVWLMFSCLCEFVTARNVVLCSCYDTWGLTLVLVPDSIVLAGISSFLHISARFMKTQVCKICFLALFNYSDILQRSQTEVKW